MEKVRWNIKEIGSQHNKYVDDLVSDLHIVSTRLKLSETRLPREAVALDEARLGENAGERADRRVEALEVADLRVAVQAELGLRLFRGNERVYGFRQRRFSFVPAALTVATGTSASGASGGAPSPTPADSVISSAVPERIARRAMGKGMSTTSP